MHIPYRLKTTSILILVAVIWGTSFIAQRSVANSLGVFLFNGFRSILGGLVLIPLIPRPWRIDKKVFALILLVGVLMFSASALQQAGMKTTTAGNAAFITSLYVVLIPFILTTVWRHHIPSMTWLCAGLAVVGVYLLSNSGPVHFSQGDGLELVGAVFWAFHVIMVGFMARKVDPWTLTSVQLLFSGVINLIFGFIFEAHTLPALSGSLWAIFYTGVFSFGIGFSLQAYCQRRAPASDVAIILSMESVFAALFGFLILHETLHITQLVGCALILTATLLAQRESLTTAATPAD
ncbi:MAG TPA: DMT family transporter [Anaerolineaceae bacterium]|nr:DMT family transporter [Anaerolineaceae bacterium]